MEQSLPLIPNKPSAVCGDVRPTLRHVFRGAESLPPLAPGGPRGASEPPAQSHWEEKYSSECKEIYQQEEDLKLQFARRLAKEPQPNVYQLRSAAPPRPDVTWKRERGIIERRDLMPTFRQDATRDTTLWIRNALNGSSCDVSGVEVRGSRIHLPTPLQPPSDHTLHSISMGEVVERVSAPPSPAPPPPPLPEYIVCVPPQLDFVNFTLGQIHTQSLRLVNVSKFELRLSVRPPRRRELSVELGARGLTVTSGAATELRVHFRPSDVRALRDELRVRVSAGAALRVRIQCYMQPPLLEILVPNVLSSALSCTAGRPPWADGGGGGGGGDVLELGARLLGDVHFARLLLHCDAAHVSFFVLTEDAWLSFTLNELTWCGSVVAGPFVWFPAGWAGGGAVGGAAWCRARAAGLQAAPLRLLASTAAARQLHLVADALHFHPDHVSLQAQEKDYDICSEDDPACEHYVHLGTAFPHRSLSGAVQLINHSVRPWGVCNCWEEEVSRQEPLKPEDDDSDRLCPGAKVLRARADGGVTGDTEAAAGGAGAAGAVLVEPQAGRVAPRSACTVHVRAPDVGAAVGVQRAVLMLVLKDIPKESFTPGYVPMIVSTSVRSETIPGLKSWSREVCEVVCAQLEVWWEVVPVRFVLDPPVVSLPYSRRVFSIELQLRATQLMGSESAHVEWRLPTHALRPPTPRLSPMHSCEIKMHLPLPVLPNEYPETDVIELSAVEDRWRAACEVRRWSALRHPALRPARSWLGVLPPEAHAAATLALTNDTHQHICWWGDVFRWWRESPPAPACAPPRAPCAACRERACTCALLRPARGALPPAAVQLLQYDVNAPESDGCVVTLVRTRRTEPDVARVAGGAGGGSARAALLAYRVLAPRLVLRVQRCAAAAGGGCCGEGCSLDAGAGGAGGAGGAVLRPGAALVAGRRACCRLRVANLTPLPTRVRWEPAIEGEDYLKVTFSPNEFDVGGHDAVHTGVVLEARRVCGRRVFVRRASVAHAYQPLYLLIDTAISGLEIVCRVPLGVGVGVGVGVGEGGGEATDSFVEIRRTQRERFPWEADETKPATAEEVFEEDDRKRKIQQENICRCPFELVYVPPEKPLHRPPVSTPISSLDLNQQLEEEYQPPEIVSKAPSLLRVCPCCARPRPELPGLAQPCCLQFRDLPLGTVRTRRLTLRNVSALAGRWSAAVRRWPRARPTPLHRDSWAGSVNGVGVALQCVPAHGRLEAGGTRALVLHVYADCWGLYRDQLLIQVEDLEPIVLDVWVEVVAPPLSCALRPQPAPRAHRRGDAPTLWMSSSDATRGLRVRNASRAHLTVHAYLLRDHEYIQDLLPLRVYLRFFDVLPPSCLCLTAFESDSYGEESAACSSQPEDMDTGIELYVAPDCGVQDDASFEVSPDAASMAPGAREVFLVTLRPPAPGLVAAPGALLLRTQPLDYCGPGWFRPEPHPQLVKLRQAAREGHLQLPCTAVRVQLCALDLPMGDVLRVRKRFRAQNIGNGHLYVTCRAESPWCLVRGKRGGGACGAGCCCHRGAENEGEGEEVLRERTAPLHLEPWSSTEICVEVRIPTEETYPCIDVKSSATRVNCGSWEGNENDGSGGGGGDPGEGRGTGAALELTGHRVAPEYPERVVVERVLYFHDEHNVIKALPLILELEYPVLRAEPACVDFGYVADGETRKAYFTVSHSSPSATLELAARWEGGAGLRVWPPLVRLPPGARARLYLQYRARWSPAPVCGEAMVSAVSGGGGWCRVGVGVVARASRDQKCSLRARDHTDDAVLTPPEAAAWLAAPHTR